MNTAALARLPLSMVRRDCAVVNISRKLRADDLEADKAASLLVDCCSIAFLVSACRRAIFSIVVASPKSK